MEKVVSFIIYYLIIYLLYFFTVILRKKKYDKYKKSKQVIYFTKVYNLDFNKISIGKFLNIIALVNSFIMATTILLVQYLPTLVLKILIAFVVLIMLLLIFYKLIGIYIERRNNDVQS